ncbi:MAG TPA: hypothetical protein PLI09_05820 [Candidatus Hydrogenedentes bacterium]|nr:hypothetical protein [Candidatus Hydrogenedentota bacterium]
MRITPRNVFILCALVVLIIGAVLLLKKTSNAQQGDGSVSQAVSGVQQVNMDPQKFKPALPPKILTVQEETKAKIAEYQKTVEAEPNAENTPALIFAMGNLYLQKLMEYEEAAHCYETLIEKYPNAPNTVDAYAQLSTCYELLNDGEKLNRLHNDMMKKFPPESQEYQYAKSKLGL